MKNSCAFVATSFGFGPVSKAVSIAAELKARAPEMQTHYFGAGISYDYARKSNIFDVVTNIDVDRAEQLVALLPELTSYRAVFSVLNLDILPLWKNGWPPLYFVDSLAWMWPSPPAGIENVSAYFVQDYLLPSQRIRDWASVCPLVLVAPIEMQTFNRVKAPTKLSNRLLVNYSGCANPFAKPDLYKDYAAVMTAGILEEAAGRYEHSVFCCNEGLASFLSGKFGDREAVQFGHLAHDEFLRLLASSEMVLSAPGITSTLEALTSEVPIRFLLPQNDSQALISERCRELLGEECCMAFSRFGLSFPPFLPPKASVALALNQLERILRDHRSGIRQMIHGLMSLPPTYSIAGLRSNITKQWSFPGQEMIVSHVLDEGVGREV